MVAVTKFSAFELIAKPKADAHYTNISSAKYYIKNDFATGLNPTAQYTSTYITSGNVISTGTSINILDK